ncbi:DUF4926 domain-containing protein [Heyndrickxia oleronia]|uniref:DUF4926 domain-containing protein n=1 Tax=Heyndrickxia oleronia TaxID=38875 RepID=UPI000A82CE21|nr:DUF4926 domain-containing protein [Heyndrickxia oleronia]MCM3239059.1 DUF4926 domain-containing protein [Heyndrickxia oleronia]MCM3452744.1 DUF4926 domain-containing protein [Heyndrickxia oleronia]GIN39039.1 hypothetical protein J19TS1_19880 [Heyndrickxia oleronia]
MKAKEFDVVETKDGKEGTILEVFQDPPGYLIEYDDDEQTIDSITDDKIEKIIYVAK